MVHGWGPMVTPHTLELTPRGRVMLQIAPQETARAYSPPEYRPGRLYSDTDSEKVNIENHWQVQSIYKTLLF